MCGESEAKWQTNENIGIGESWHGVSANETKKIEENEKDMAKIGAYGVGNHGGGAHGARRRVSLAARGGGKRQMASKWREQKSSKAKSQRQNGNARGNGVAGGGGVKAENES
jgi:hypothetical protein